MQHMCVRVRQVPQNQRRCCICLAKRQSKAQSKSSSTRKRTGLFGWNKPKGPPKEEEKPSKGLAKWNIFTPAEYNSVPSWDVPWGWQTITGGMLAWAVTFVLTGLLAVPIGSVFLNITNFSEITAMQRSEIQLFDQVLSTIAGVGLIKLISSRARPSPVPDDFLRVSLSDPFSFPSGWAAWSITGLAVAPVAIIVSASVFSLLPQDLSGGRGTVDAVSGLVETVDPIIFVNLIIVTGILAPILEETVFRGFLLTSLTQYMSLPAAAAVSSLLFAACHLSLRDFPQLFALGMVMGLAYGRSRNLLTSITIHAAWNSSVVVMLFLLVNSGMPMSEILGQ